MRQFSLYVAVLLMMGVIRVCAQTNVGTLEGALGWGETDVKKKIAHLDEGRYITSGLDVSNKHIQLSGSKYTEIQPDGTASQKAIFIGKDSYISLQNLRFKTDINLVAIVEMNSNMVFIDNTLIGITISNCFEVDGGELILSNLKLEFENIDERRISNLVNFGKLGGNLHVLKTSIVNVLVHGDRPLFGDRVESEISLTNCKFNQVHIDNSSTSNLIVNIIISQKVFIQDCTFINVENALEGGVVNSLNSNGNLLVVGSLFQRCHNTKHITEGVSNKEYHTDIVTGDAIFSDDTFEYCSSQDFGGSISFISNGKLSIKDVSFRSSTSYGGKGGAIYFEGNGELSLNDVSFKECRSLGQLIGQGGAIYIEGNGYHTIRYALFTYCQVSGKEISEGGTIYSKGGKNKIIDISIKQSSALITEYSLSNIDTDQSSSLGGGIMAIYWLNESVISDISFTSCIAGSGGGIYMDSTSDRIKFSNVRFYKNIASVSGGGAIFAQNTNMIQLSYNKFSDNQAYGSEYGNDLHFGGFALIDGNINLDQVQRDTIQNCESTSLEPRLCINEYGCLQGWIIDDQNEHMTTWQILTVVLSGLIFSLLIVGMCSLCSYNLISLLLRRKKLNDILEVENKNKQLQTLQSIEDGQYYYNNQQRSMQQQQYNSNLININALQIEQQNIPYPIIQNTKQQTNTQNFQSLTLLTKHTQSFVLFLPPPPIQINQNHSLCMTKEVSIQILPPVSFQAHTQSSKVQIPHHQYQTPQQISVHIPPPISIQILPPPYLDKANTNSKVLDDAKQS